MEEEKTAPEQNLEQITDTEAVNPTIEEAEQAPQLKGIRKLIWFIKTHENLRQLVLFTLFSLVCFVIEYASFTVLKLCLKNVNQPVEWVVFVYSTEIGGMGAFIAFLVSNVLAQAATFLLNRKKTFHSNNNIAIAGSMYAVVTCGIILLVTYLGGIISKACYDSMIKYSTLSPEALNNISAYISKFVGSFISFVIAFVSNKFLIMRDWSKKSK